MAKRTAHVDSGFIGFISETSPLKQKSDGQFKYFNASLQMANGEHKRIVCFDEQKHHMVETMDKQGTPVKLTNAALIPSLKPDCTDIKLTRFSQITGLSPDAVHFKRRKLDLTVQNSAPVTKVVDVSQAKEDITVIIKVINIKETTSEHMFNRVVKKQIITIADNTAQINLALYDALIGIVNEGNCYEIMNVQTRNYDSLCLTATARTKITECTDVGTTSSTPIDNPQTEILFKQIAITIQHKCASCYKVVNEMGEKFTRCTNCTMKSLTKDLHQSVSIKTNALETASNTVKKLLITENALQLYINDKNLTLDVKTPQDSEDIEELLLGQSFHVSIHRDIITQIVEQP